jgi:hypothetical protein
LRRRSNKIRLRPDLAKAGIAAKPGKTTGKSQIVVSRVDSYYQFGAVTDVIVAWSARIEPEHTILRARSDFKVIQAPVVESDLLSSVRGSLLCF